MIRCHDSKCMAHGNEGCDLNLSVRKKDPPAFASVKRHKRFTFRNLCLFLFRSKIGFEVLCYCEVTMVQNLTLN